MAVILNNIVMNRYITYLVLLVVIPCFTFANNFKKITNVYTNKSKTIIYYDTVNKKRNILMKSKEYTFIIREISKNKKWALISNLDSSYLNTRLYYIPEEKYVNFMGIHKNILPVLIYSDEKGEFVGVDDYTDEEAEYFHINNRSINKKYYLNDLEKKVKLFDKAQSIAND